MKKIKKVLYINANTYLHCDHDAFVITQTCINEKEVSKAKTYHTSSGCGTNYYLWTDNSFELSAWILQ